MGELWHIVILSFAMLAGSFISGMAPLAFSLKVFLRLKKY